MKDYDDYQRGDLPPLPSRAMRRIAKRSKSSSRGGVVVKLKSWARARIVYFESKLEQRVLFLLLARGDVIDIWEQPPLIDYHDEDGRRKHHFFDFLVQLENGLRFAIAVKPAKIAARSRFVGQLRSVRKALHKDYADELVLITDADFTKAEALNAERYHEFSRAKDEVIYAKLDSLVETTPFPISVGDLSDAMNAGGLGFRSIFIAIYEGLLSTDKTKVIDVDTLVCRGDAR